MQKVTIKTIAPRAILKDGKPAIEYDTKLSDYVTASTKSTNNLVDDLKASGVLPASVTVKDFFIDRKEAVALATTLVERTADIEPALRQSVVNHIIKALDGACLFERPPVKRKK